MNQCILNVSLWNGVSKITYLQVHGSPVLQAHFLQILWWRSVTIFAELIQFWQNSKCRRKRTFWRKRLVFHWRKIWYFFFIYIYIYIYIPVVLLFISLFQIYNFELAQWFFQHWNTKVWHKSAFIEFVEKIWRCYSQLRQSAKYGSPK